MSMATRCTSCGTIFRVVQDQLKVSEGWVRCGRCDEVFNALEGLFDLERDKPPPWIPRSAEQASAQAEQRREAFSDAGEQTVAELDEDDRIASRFFRPEQDDVDHSPAESVASRDRADFADAQFNTELLADNGDEALPLRDMPPTGKKAGSGTPAFVRHAERQERWRRPWARVTLSLAAVLLLISLLLQIGHHFRDHFAAQWPQTRALLGAWCELADCRIDAPRRIDDVSVDSTSLSRAAPGSDDFRLTVTLRNRGALPVSSPWIELSLTDPNGQLIARRALAPRDFRAPLSVIQAGGDAALQLLFSVGSARVTGYTVELFYP